MRYLLAVMLCLGLAGCSSDSTPKPTDEIVSSKPLSPQELQSVRDMLSQRVTTPTYASPPPIETGGEPQWELSSGGIGIGIFGQCQPLKDVIEQIGFDIKYNHVDAIHLRRCVRGAWYPPNAPPLGTPSGAYGRWTNK